MIPAIWNGSWPQEVEQPPDRFQQLSQRRILHHPRRSLARRLPMRWRERAHRRSCHLPCCSGINKL